MLSHRNTYVGESYKHLFYIIDFKKKKSEKKNEFA